MTPQEARTMKRDFVYCPGCKRYSIVRWVRKLSQWKCEDCTYKLPKLAEPTEDLLELLVPHA
jgi:ribosomal protein L37AE/L43A